MTGARISVAVLSLVVGSAAFAQAPLDLTPPGAIEPAPPVPDVRRDVAPPAAERSIAPEPSRAPDPLLDVPTPQMAAPPIPRKRPDLSESAMTPSQRETVPLLPFPEAAAPGQIAPAQLPGITSVPAAGASDASADLAYGAFQRGYYLTAFRHAIERAAAGDVAAQTLLGHLYEGGYGVARNFQEAVAWYGLAARGGDREAQFALGLMHLEGRGVPVDREKAVAYLEPAAKAGKVAAIYQLARLHLDGRSGRRDPARAADLLKSAAEAGNADAQYALAQLYATGDGVPRDDAAAAEWLAAAARLGHIDAEVEYAIRLFNGTGVAKDESGAAELFRRAADVGNPIAQNRLARILAAGRGLPADPVAAAKWHFLARAAGRDDAFLEEFIAGLDDEQRQAAATAAQRWPTQ